MGEDEEAIIGDEAPAPSAGDPASGVGLTSSPATGPGVFGSHDTGRDSTRWLAGALFLLALFDVASFGYNVLPAGVVRSATGLMAASSVVAFVSVPLYVGILFAFWAMARGRAGATLLLLAAVCGILAPTLGAAPALFMLLPESALELFISAQSYASFAVLALSLAAKLLFAAGLLKTRMAPRWVGWFGIAAAAAGAATYVLGRMLHVYPAIGTLLSACFFVVLGVALVRRSLATRTRTPGFALVGAVFGIVLLATVAMATTVGVRYHRAAAAQEQSAVVSKDVFARLFPGFTNEGELPVMARGDAGSSVEQFDIKRAGPVVMQVEFSADRSLVDTGGPMHGKPVGFDVRGVGRFWMGDSYFSAGDGGQYSSISRPLKLALWDAFAASQKQRVRILGVFPVEQLRDRSLLATDGYRPKDLDGTTLVVYTPEFESAVNEEVPWATADELIANARRYEDDNRSNDGTSSDRLDVRAFSWDGSRWNPAARQTAAK